MSLITEGRGYSSVTMGHQGVALLAGSLATYPISEQRECYRAIFPIFSLHRPVFPFASRAPPRPGARRNPTSHPRNSTRRDGHFVIMAKVEKMDPVWDDLDR